ncbi:hypothetical protein HOI83_02410 [Candidatus Uhrbacteria bacterium]|jgi:hypothetical protein|nr:hypothetical protein [Candidatus Uhrbacteria bacterium]
MDDPQYDARVRFLCIKIPLLTEPTIKERQKRKDELKTLLGLSGNLGARIVTVLCHIRKTSSVSVYIWQVVGKSRRDFQNTKHSGPKTLEAWEELLATHKLVPGLSIEDEAIYNARWLTTNH